MKPPVDHGNDDMDRLFAVLEEWQPQLQTDPGFAAALRRRLAQLRAPRPVGRIWRWQTWTLAGATAAAALAMVVYWSQPKPVETPVMTVAVVQDLQMWNRNADLIENLDFLQPPAAHRSVEEQN